MSDERVRRRLAAIVTIDMVAYSRRMSEDETGTYELLKSQRRELINPKIGAYSGRIVKRALTRQSYRQNGHTLCHRYAAPEVLRCRVRLGIGQVLKGNHGQRAR